MIRIAMPSASPPPTLEAVPCRAIATGAAALDARLGGGIAAAALHEIFAARSGDAASAAGFALLLAVRISGVKPIVWVREDRGERLGGRVHAPGLAELGIDPERLVIITAPDALAVLRAGADIVNCSAVGAVVIEPHGRASVFDLTASRRLTLAAARSGVTALVLRSDVEPLPSAAMTRWHVAASASAALEANAPGAPAFALRLLRHRGGVNEFEALVEWDRDRTAFRDARLSGGVPAFAVRRTAAAERQAA